MASSNDSRKVDQSKQRINEVGKAAQMSIQSHIGSIFKIPGMAEDRIATIFNSMSGVDDERGVSFLNDEHIELIHDYVEQNSIDIEKLPFTWPEAVKVIEQGLIENGSVNLSPSDVVKEVASDKRLAEIVGGGAVGMKRSLGFGQNTPNQFPENHALYALTHELDGLSREVGEYKLDIPELNQMDSRDEQQNIPSQSLGQATLGPNDAIRGVDVEYEEPDLEI